MDDARFFKRVAIVFLALAVLHKMRAHGGFGRGYAGVEGEGRPHRAWAGGVPPFFAEWHRRAHASETQSV